MSSGQCGVALDKNDGRYVCNVLSGFAPNAKDFSRGYKRLSCSCRLNTHKIDASLFCTWRTGRQKSLKTTCLALSWMLKWNNHVSAFAWVDVYLGERAFLGMKAKSSKGKNSLGPMIPNPFVKFAWSLEKKMIIQNWYRLNRKHPLMIERRKCSERRHSLLCRLYTRYSLSILSHTWHTHVEINNSMYIIWHNVKCG